MNDKKQILPGYAIQINLSATEMNSFLAGWQEMQNDLADSVMEASEFAEANKVIARIKAM